jgi:16S rRNA U1498 N3-methylase RsmE
MMFYPEACFVDFQSRIIRTATAVIYLLIEAMPIEAEIHK